MKHIFLLGLFALGLTTLFNFRPASAQTLCLNLSFSQKAAFRDAQIAVFDKIYERAGLCLTPVIVPNKRGNSMLAEGLLDGDAIGSPIGISRNPNLITVPTALIRDKDVMVATKIAPIQTLDQLAGQRIGVSRGVHWDQYLSQIPGIDLARSPERKQLVTLLQLDRVDAIAIRQSYFNIFAHDFKGPSKPMKVIFDLDEINLYHSLDRKHAPLSARIDAAISALQAEGKIPVTGSQWAKLYTALKQGAPWPDF